MKKLPKEELQKILNNCKSKADFCRALELNPKGGNYKIIDRIIKDNQLISNFTCEPWNKGKKYRAQIRSLDEILVENSPHHNTYSLKLRLIRSGLKKSKCEICGHTDKIELHHINGNPSDNRLENLQILCPNCHAQTNNYRIKNSEGYKKRQVNTPETLFLTEEEAAQRDLERKAKKCHKTVEQYVQDKQKLSTKTCPVCGKEFRPRGFNQTYCSVECYSNERKGNRPSLIQLISDFRELKSFVQVGKKYGITDNAVRKWCMLYGVPIHAKDMKEYIENFNNPNYTVPENKVFEKKILNYDKIIQDYQSGLNTIEVAKINNCCVDSVKNILEKNKIEYRNNYKSVVQYDLENNELLIFESTGKAAQWLIDNNYTKAKIHSVSGFIRQCCLGEKATAYKFKWKYKI